MRFEILGPIRVIDDDVVADLGGPRQQRVLASLLAVSPMGLGVDRLIDEVWGEQPPDTASHVIRTYVSNLRKILGDRLVSDGHHYQIDTTDDGSDAIEFERMLDEARVVLPADPAAAAALLHDSAPLWRGRPFGDLASGAPLIGQRAAELEEERVQSIELLMAAELALGHHESVVADLQSLTRAHPVRERLHQDLMLALYRNGRQAEALRIGWELRTRLVEELGIEPSVETRDLEDRILLQDPGLDLLPPTNLPAFVSSFIGRGQDIGEVSKLLDVDRFVTLVGVGGVGKTRLAREVGEQVLGRFQDGVWWVDLAPLASEESVAGKVATVLSLAVQPGVDAEALLRRYLSRRRVLLVLDNCEHVAAEVSRLSTRLLEAAPGLKVLATTRQILRAPGEARYEVSPLSLPLGVIGASDAERLFVARAMQLDAGFVVSGDIAADVAEICRTLEGLPLAIEMAAVRVSMLSPAQIADRLADRLRFLTTGGGSPSRHRSLAAAIDWSYDLLTPAQQILFDRLAVFVGPFDLEASEAVAGWDPLSTDQVLDDLTSLLDASMITRNWPPDDTVRYRMLDTLRVYGLERLATRGEHDVTSRLHSRHFLETVEDSAELRFTPDHPVAVARIATGNDDLLVALEWSLRHEPRTATLAAASGLAQYWFARGDPAPASRYGRDMLENADATPPAMLAAAHLCVAFGSQLTGDFAGAVVAQASALEILEHGDDWRLLLWAYNGQGQGGVFTGLPELTADMGRHILDLCRSHDAALPRAYGLALLGEAEFFGDGDLDEARRHIAEAIPLFRELGDEAALNMFALGILAGVAALQLDFRAAERAAVEASTLGGPGWSATALLILGAFVLHPRGETDRAEAVLIRGVLRVHERSMEVWVRTGLLALGRIAAQRGRWEDAARLFGGCRPQLPPWAQHRRWWNYEPVVRRALGADTYDRIADAAAGEPLDDLVGWATRSQTEDAVHGRAGRGHPAT